MIIDIVEKVAYKIAQPLCETGITNSYYKRFFQVIGIKENEIP